MERIPIMLFPDASSKIRNSIRRNRMKHLYPYLRRFRKESILAPLFKRSEEHTSELQSHA